MNKFKNALLYTSLTAIACLIAGLIVFHKKSSTLTNKAQMPPINVPVANVQKMDFYKYISAIGQCNQFKNVDIVPQVSGKLTAVKHKIGGFVMAGDLLFEVESDFYKNALIQAEGQLSSDNAALHLALAKLQRSESLRSKDFVSQQEYDTYKAAVDECEGRVAASTAICNLRKIDLDRCKIFADFDGYISCSRLDEGNVVAAFGGAIASLKDVSKLYVDFNLPEKAMPSVFDFMNSGSDLIVDVTLLDDANSKKSGKIVFFENTINKSTGSFGVRAEIDNNDHSFWPGRSVEIKLHMDKLADALMVPSSAINLSEKGPYVFIVNSEAKAEMRLVTTGQSANNLTVIEAGLNGDELVIQDGHPMLIPGATIMRPLPSS